MTTTRDDEDHTVSRTPALPETYRGPGDRRFAWVGRLLILAAVAVGAGVLFAGVVVAVVALLRALN